MKKGFFIVALLMLLPMLAFSQTISSNRQIMEEGKTIFKPHAYLQLQGGAAHTLGEAKFMDLISPAAALNLGYKFSPVFGMRLGGSGWQGKGGWVSPAQLYDFKYVQGNLDFVFDLGSLFGGFNPDRVVNPYLFLGGGATYGFENDKANSLNTSTYDLEYLWQDSKLFFPTARGGLGIDFRLSDAVALNIEGNANMISDHFNSKKAGNPDWQFNALVGLKINLGKTYTKTEPIYYPEPEPAPAPPPAPKPEPKPEPKPVVVRTLPEMPPIHFRFDSDVVDSKKYATELSTIVSVLKEYSELNAVVVGYTDHHGPDKYNDGLSVRRAENVKKYLVEQGIAASRLSIDGEGKDPKTTGPDRLTIKARRVEVKE